MALPSALRESHPDGDPAGALAIADQAEAAGDLRLAATALDRVYGLVPHDPAIGGRRRRVLDQLAVTEHGVTFRYVPTGMFLMGSKTGDPDERPVRPTLIENFWLSETTISWAAFCRLLGWTEPPQRVGGSSTSERLFMDLYGGSVGVMLEQAARVRLQYCEDHTNDVRGWHSHDPAQLTSPSDTAAGSVPGVEIFGRPPRPADAPWRYEDKPMVAVSWQEAEFLAAMLSTTDVRYRLPTEAEWEKAARGGLIGCRYAWGNEAPTDERCDFGRFEPFAIKPSRMFAPNGYGLYAMCGSVWEWTADDYVISGRSMSPTRERVLRGGSWADPAEVVTVSFRMSRCCDPARWPLANHIAPNVGFRLCRVERRPVMW